MLDLDETEGEDRTYLKQCCSKGKAYDGIAAKFKFEIEAEFEKGATMSAPENLNRSR